MTCLPQLLSAAVLVLAPGLVHAAMIPDGATCTAAIAEVEHSARLPSKMLDAIGVVESGRLDLRTSVVAPWPWTINVAGVGRMFDSAADAIAAVQAAQAAGVQSIDVGCMQVNLLHHPHAFATLDAAFDPASNVRYAAGFLALLRTQTGDWPSAVAAYHSATGPIGASYAQRVAAVWPLAAEYGLPSPVGPARVSTALPDETIDPTGVLTPEFRARMVASSAFRRERDKALGLTPPGDAAAGAGGSRMAEIAPANAGRTAAWPAKGVVGARMSLVSVAAIDPRNILTPEFRAQCLAEAEARRRRDLAYGPARQATPSPVQRHSP